MQSQAVSSDGERDARQMTPLGDVAAEAKTGPIKRRHWLECSMEHSGITMSQPKQRHSSVQDGAVLCLSLPPLPNEASPGETGRELARCLHEPKYHLMREVVEVIGVEKSLQCFAETAQVQENGGVVTSDGSKKRAPGGVFLEIVKRRTTVEEKKKIFSRDKKDKERRANKKKKEKKKAKWREERKQREREVQEKAEKELEKFHRELEIMADEKVLESANSYKGIEGRSKEESERGGRKGERRTRNEEGGQVYVDLDDPNTLIAEDGEIIEDEEEKEEDFHEVVHSSVFEQPTNRVKDEQWKEKGEGDTKGLGKEEKEIEEMETDSLAVSDRTKNRLRNPSQELHKTSEDVENNGVRRIQGGKEVEEVVNDSTGPDLSASSTAELNKKAVEEEEEAAAEQFESMNESDLDLKLGLGLVFN